jgi:hypothetical protein
VRYGFTGSEQTFVVPAGVHALNLVAIGGRGGTGQGGVAGGVGAVATANVPITPGAVLYIEVGGNGAGATPAGPGPAGFNGGGGGGSNPLGRHGGAGGDASDVRTVARSVPGSVASRVVTAGGGGGGGAAWVSRVCRSPALEQEEAAARAASPRWRPARRSRWISPAQAPR